MNRGSLCRCAKSTFKSSLFATAGGKGGPETRPKTTLLSQAEIDRAVTKLWPRVENRVALMWPVNLPPPHPRPRRPIISK